jgi:N-terminal domain of toast_rack, DUF2154
VIALNKRVANSVSPVAMLKAHRVPVMAVVPCLLILVGCEFDNTSTGSLQEEPVAIELGHADHANVELDMGAGEMVLRGGAEKLLEGRFEFNVPDWRPKVQSSISGSHATITIHEPENARRGGKRQYRWDLALNDNVLLDLAMNCGAGHARLQLGDLELRSVTVHMGAGQVDLDLRGHPTRDYDVNVSGGVGQATIRLPDNVGVRAEAHGGIGSIDVSGLEKHGDHYENSLYDNAKANIRLKVEGGIGEIRIIG